MRTNMARLRLKTPEFDLLARARFGVETDRDVAQRLGVNKTNLSLMRNGHMQPGEILIVRIMTGLNCRFEDVFEITEVAQ